MGEVIADRFELGQLAGAGATGEVFRAHDRATGETVALKVWRRSSDNLAERFSREARVLSELRHPAIVRYVAHGETPSRMHYLAMEWLEGEDLARRLERGALTVPSAIRLGLRIAEGLGAAHRCGVIHRDIKPANLFLVADRIEDSKILDFGIARFGHLDSSLTRSAVIGTPSYMAPEQARGARKIDARVDVFALGCVLFRAIGGRTPFTGDDVRAVLAKILFEEAPRLVELCDDVPSALDNLVARMLAKDPAERPADGDAVFAELSDLMRHEVSSARARSTMPPALGAGEQRVVSMILTDPAGGGVPVDLQEIAERFGARLDALLDGSLAVTLAATQAPRERAAHAARCALAMRERLGEVSIALATGRGVTGHRAPVGEVIDRAAALLRAPGAGEIRIDSASAGLLDARFDVGGDAHGLLLRGERSVVESVRTLLGRPTPIFGREREIAMLLSVHQGCVAEPAARAVVVTAAAGVGKSRLRQEVVRAIAEDAPEGETWLARGDSMSAGSPFGLVSQMVRAASGIHDGELESARRRKLAARVGRFVPAAESERVTEFLAEIVGARSDVPSPQLRAARQDPMLMGDQIRRAWEELVLAECDEHPLLIVLEDLHWGDLPSVKLIDAALRTLNEKPLMVLAMARPELDEVFPRLWADRSLQVLRLDPLGRKAGERLVTEALPSAQPATVARVVERAAGNAFFLEELIRSIAEGRDDDLPDTVLAMVDARLQRLDPGARRVLRAASVFGRVFWRGGVLSLLGGDARASEVDEWLEVLVEREIVSRVARSRFPDAELRFQHALVRDAAYAMLTDEDRCLGHELAGAWLERSGEREAVVLAEHFERGGALDRAIDGYRRAAEQALEGNDIDAVIARAARSIACGAKGTALGEARLLQAEAWSWSGDTTAAIRACEEALSTLEPGTRGFHRALGTTALLRRRLGRIDALGELPAILRAVETRDVSHTLAGTRLAANLYIAGRLADGDAVLADLAVDIETMPPNVRAPWHQAKACRAVQCGDAGAYLTHTTEVVRCFAEAGNARGGSISRCDMAHAQLELGAFAEAEATLREALASARRMGLDYVASVTLNNLGLALARQGRLDEARAVETEAVQGSIAHGDVRLEGGSRLYLAGIDLLRGDLATAEHEAKLAVHRLESFPGLAASALATLAEVHLEQGRAVEALEAARRAHEILSARAGIEEGEARLRLVHARALHATGAVDAAREAISAARDRLNARAAAIGDAELRRAFLERVPENARTLDLAREWLDALVS